MKKKKVLWMCTLLLLLAGCISDDDNFAINDKNILGYWESTATVNSKGGFMFVSNGEIKYWEQSLIRDNGQYLEQHWGYFWYDDDGTIHIQNRPKDSDPNPDELYYKVMSVTKDRLVIRTFGGYAGIPLEKGTDVVYNKTDKPNK
jgi:uncharacterized protein YcfL